MSSSSSSGYSDEDPEPSAPSAAAPPASELSHAVELAQICSFCTTFRQPLRLPSFSRTDLQEAILGASNGDTTHVELLAELHFKLAREHPTAKMEKMVQDWEKTLARKLQENWRKEFTANPMGGGVTYAELTVFERVKILDALCHWKLDTCTEILKHIANLQKENDNEGIKRLREGEIGTDDKGVSYWYFDDGCWIFAEDKPRWQLEERKPSYMVEFASAKRIRLSINFDPDQDSTAPPLRLPVKSVVFADQIKEEKTKKEAISSDSKVNSDGVSLKLETGQATAELVKIEKEETTSVSTAKELHITSEGTAVKEEATPAVQTPTACRMDINVLCAFVSPLSEEADPHQSNGSIQKQDGENMGRSEGVATLSITTAPIESPRSPGKVQEGMALFDKKIMALNEEDGASKSPGKESPGKVNEDNAGDHTHPSVVAVVGSKKRTIIDDDSSDSSSSDVDTSKEATDKKVDHQAASSPPPRKKRKASTESTSNAAALTIKDESTEPVSMELNGTTTSQESEGDTVAKEASSVVSKADSVPTVVKEMGLPSPKANTEANTEAVNAKESSPAQKVAPSSEESGNTEVKESGDTASGETPSVPASMSPTADPAAAPESFDITCESCKKCYDMRYVDPPLVERPTEEWRCFECLVNDARGWPRRRKSTRREPFSPREDESSSRRRGSSSKSRSGSSSSKKTKKSSSKSRSSASSKKKSSSSKRNSSSSKSSSSKKSSSSSSKKHKKRKSSSSSHHSSSHGHHRRRHHSHYHHAEFAKLVTLFRERQEQRLGIEEARINGDLQMAFDEAPQGWRVVSSTLDDLRALIESLSGGSLEQDRLRGRLIVIMKDQEKQEEERRKQQELAWNILPRRQSSRIAIGRMKDQSTQESDGEDRYSDDDMESRRPGLRSRRSQSATSDGVDGKQKHDRAWRARRRHQGSDDEDLDEEDNELDINGVSAGNWIDWSLLKKWKLFKKDVELVWQNCRTFNAPDTLVVQFADLLSKLSRSMCIAAEKKGVDRMKDRRSGDDESGNDSDGILSDASKAESRSSINKAWTESKDEDFSGDDKANKRPPTPQNGAPSPSPPPPPPPHVAQKRPKPRLIISDSSSSDSSDSDGNSSSSSSSSSDSDESDSDARPANRTQPPPPSSTEAPAPPPPSLPPPAASPEDSKPPVRSSPSQKAKPKTAATQGKKKAPPTTETGYTHSPALLNSYLSPSSSSSSDFSSGDSDSSDADSESD
ncbi:hypothetical protein JG688_00001654 [Phytophthora aleatoria]|uniref:DDT domain-containing protein n=1 Tax=Phytophthora aleatoria TaxID=2496075 RepID=A0A8J5J6F7_9STRA|nr:hypothetical protein JG688_00001654 [Phytophthora aleatoria]